MKRLFSRLAVSSIAWLGLAWAWQESVTWIGDICCVACVAIPSLSIFGVGPKWYGARKVYRLAVRFVATWTKRNWIAARVIHCAKMLKCRLRMRCLEIRMLLLKSRILCLQRGYLRGDEPELRFNVVLCRVVINHPLELLDVLRDAAHIVAVTVKRPNRTQDQRPRELQVVS